MKSLLFGTRVVHRDMVVFNVPGEPFRPETPGGPGGPGGPTKGSGRKTSEPNFIHEVRT